MATSTTQPHRGDEPPSQVVSPDSEEQYDSPAPSSPSANQHQQYDLGKAADQKRHSSSKRSAMPDSALELYKWDSQQLDQLVNQLDEYQYGSVLRSFQHAHLEEPARLLSWHHLTYTTKDKHKILDDVSGILEPGQLVGLIGGSDSGITPLLTLLAMQHEQFGKVDGHVLYDKLPRSAEFKRQVGFVVKDDNHLPILTVFETLYFSARMRMPTTVPDKVVAWRVSYVMKMLGISKTRDTVVGNGQIRGISGGEKRRLGFALELVAGHSVILADLPTNGLDSATALDVIKSCSAACHEGGISILASLVQPSRELFMTLDKVMVLIKGKQLYYGPPADVEEWLGQAGFQRPEIKSVPQWLEEVSSTPELYYSAEPQRSLSDGTGKDHSAIDVEKSRPNRRQAFEVLDKHYTSSSHHHKTVEFVDSFGKDSHGSKHSKSVQPVSEQESSDVKQLPWNQHKGLSASWYHSFSSSPWVQIKTAVWQQYLLTRRNTGMWRDAWLMAMTLGFVIGSLYWMTGVDSTSVRNRGGLATFVTSFICFNTISLCSILEFYRPVYYSQRERQYYQGTVYYAALIACMIPIVVIECMLILLPVWGLAGLSGWPFISQQFWYAYLILLTFDMTSRFFTSMVHSAVPSVTYALVAVIMLDLMFSVVAGFFIPLSKLPNAWYWVHQVSYITYGLIGWLVNDLDSIRNNCNPADVTCTYLYGSDAITELFGLPGNANKWIYWLYLGAFMLGFGVLSALAYWKFDYSEYDMPETPNYVEEKAGEDVEEPEANAQQHQVQRQLSNGQGAAGVEMAGAAHHNQDLEAGSGHELSQPDVQRQESDGALKQKGASLDFVNLCYDVFPPGEDGKPTTKRLLTNISAYCHPGMMVALMGATGAGKTTLLDVLAGQKTSGKASGQILINGKPRDESYSHIAGYVEQFDSLEPYSTVRESIRFAGQLRLPKETTAAKLDKKVDNVLRILGIGHLQHEMIGAPGIGGVSQEVRKKVTIGVELIMEPQLLYLDEPTTGLDSAGAQAVMAAVRALAKNISVVCTIHQPAAEIVEMFDWLLLLKPGGKVVYFNPMKDLPAYFKEHGFGECAPDKNIADFALERVKAIDSSYSSSEPASDKTKAASEGEEDEQHTDQRKDLAEVFAQSEQGKKTQSTLRNTLKEFGVEYSEEPQDQPLAPEHDGPRQSQWTQFTALVNRNFHSFYRNRIDFNVRIGINLFFGFIVGTAAFQAGYDQIGPQVRLGALFLALTFAMFTGGQFMHDMYTSRAMKYREQTADMYGAWSFYTSKFVAHLPYVLVQQLILGSMIYFLADINSQEQYVFGYLYGILILLYYVGLSIVFALGAICVSENLAVQTMSLIFNLMFATSGFLVAKPNIPAWWIWLFWANFVHYPLQFASALAMRDQNYTCSTNLADGQLVPVIPGYNLCAIPADIPAGYKCAIQCGKDLLAQEGVYYTDDWIVYNFICLLAFMVGLYVIGYLGTRYVRHISR